MRWRERIVMWDGWGPDGWAGWLFMSLMMIVVWGGLIVLVVWAVRSFSRPAAEDRSARRPSEALAILEERFARGEIDREAFERRRSILREVRPGEGG